MQAKEYRPDIDVLRAIAILAVVFYHANIPFFNGGYVGVSIFFVISGYLITGIIKRRLENSTFSFLEFYENRIRRILPALLVMMFIMSVLVILTSVDKGEVRQIQSSVKRCLLAIPNIFFYLNTNYFDPAADTMHLLHTWSLGVEEQFYFIIPALLFLLHKKTTSAKTLCFLFALFLLSFVSSLFVIQYSQKFTFYMLPTRAWELLMGSLLAYTAWTPKTQQGKILCSLLGLLLMFASIIGYGKETFPGFWAFPPCFGACLYIAGGTKIDKTILDWLTKNKVFVFIGVVSYSFYLWHWPIFVFYSTFPNYKEISPFAGLGLSLLAFAVAVLSWRFVEKPVRQNPFFKNRKRLWSGTVVLIAASIGLADHFNYPFAPESEYTGTKYQVAQFGTPREDNVLDVVLIGDSHSASASTAINVLCGKYGLSGKHEGTLLRNVYKEGESTQTINGRKEEWKKFTNFLKRHKINTLIFAYRYNLYLFGSDMVRRPSQIRNLKYIDNPDLPRTEALYRSLKDSIDEAYALGVKNIIIQVPVPEAKSSVPAGAGKLHTFLGYNEDEINLHLGESTEHYKTRLAECLSVLERIKKEYPQIYWVDLKPLLLDEKQQVYKVINGKDAFYYDDDHLSKEGALYTMPAYDEIFKKIFK